jgi:hypothetical protein
MGTHWIASLYDKHRCGAPSSLTTSDIKMIEQLLGEHPQSPKTVLAKFAKKTGKTISISTLKRRVIKKSNLYWKRVRKSLKSLRYPEKFEAASMSIQRLKEQQQAFDFDLFFFDYS